MRSSDLHLQHLRIETEEVAGVAVHAVDGLFRLVPEGLPPVVPHVAGRGRVVEPEVVLPHIVARHGLDGVAVISITKDVAVADR